MELKEAKRILKLHNKWRRGTHYEMQAPVKIGIAIDTILNYLKHTTK